MIQKAVSYDALKRKTKYALSLIDPEPFYKEAVLRVRVAVDMTTDLTMARLLPVMLTTLFTILMALCFRQKYDYIYIRMFGNFELLFVLVTLFLSNLVAISCSRLGLVNIKKIISKVFTTMAFIFFTSFLIEWFMTPGVNLIVKIDIITFTLFFWNLFGFGIAVILFPVPKWTRNLFIILYCTMICFVAWAMFNRLQRLIILSFQSALDIVNILLLPPYLKPEDYTSAFYYSTFQEPVKEDNDITKSNSIHSSKNNKIEEIEKNKDTKKTPVFSSKDKGTEKKTDKEIKMPKVKPEKETKKTPIPTSKSNEKITDESKSLKTTISEISIDQKNEKTKVDPLEKLKTDAVKPKKKHKQIPTSSSKDTEMTGIKSEKKPKKTPDALSKDSGSSETKPDKKAKNKNKNNNANVTLEDAAKMAKQTTRESIVIPASSHIFKLRKRTDTHSSLRDVANSMALPLNKEYGPNALLVLEDTCQKLMEQGTHISLETIVFYVLLLIFGFEDANYTGMFFTFQVIGTGFISQVVFKIFFRKLFPIKYMVLLVGLICSRLIKIIVSPIFKHIVFSNIGSMGLMHKKFDKY